MVRCDIEAAFQASSPKTSGPARPALFLCYCVEDWSADSNEPLGGRASDPQESEAAGNPASQSQLRHLWPRPPRPLPAARSSLSGCITAWFQPAEF